MKVHVTTPGLELNVVLYGLANDDEAVLANAKPITLAAAVASFVSSNCSGNVFLLAPKSWPAVPPVITLHALAPIGPEVV